MAVYVALGKYGSDVVVQRTDGVWVPGRLEATLSSDSSWSGQVRFVGTDRRECLEWVDAERINRGRVVEQRTPMDSY